MTALHLDLLPVRLAICRLGADAPIPLWASQGFVSIARTDEELSVVCREEAVPQGVRCKRGWRAFKVRGPLDFGLTGILSSLALPLAQAGVPIFAISTFDTDYLLVEESRLQEAVRSLRQAGHQIGE